MNSRSKISTTARIHKTSDVSAAEIGAQTRIMQFAVIEDGVTVGEHCQIDPLCLVKRCAAIGDRVTIGGGAHVAADAKIGCNVIIGANSVIGTADAGERAPIVHDGASVGANVTVASGVEVGQYAKIEDGSVVTSNVPPGATVAGNPAVMHQGTLQSERATRHQSPRESHLPGVKFLDLQEVTDVRGTLTVCQWDRQLPFTPRRVFFLHTVPSENVRGAHAHKECDQVLVCFNGSVNVLVDDGQQREEHVLDCSSRGLLIPAGIWATQYRYSANAMLVVFASHDYDADDYIRNYEDFLAYRRKTFDSAA